MCSFNTVLIYECRSITAGPKFLSVDKIINRLSHITDDRRRSTVGVMLVAGFVFCWSNFLEASNAEWNVVILVSVVSHASGGIHFDFM